MGHDSNSIWATLEIQYKASRASVLERTARRDESTQERVQTRSTFEDLKALKIIWDDVCPTGYEIGWGLAVVRVRWRLEKGCVSHCMRFISLVRDLLSTLSVRTSAATISDPRGS